MDFIAGMMKDAPTWLMAISGIMTSLTVITALTPTKVDDKYLGKATNDYCNFTGDPRRCGNLDVPLRAVKTEAGTSRS